MLQIERSNRCDLKKTSKPGKLCIFPQGVTLGEKV